MLLLLAAAAGSRAAVSACLTDAVSQFCARAARLRAALMVSLLQAICRLLV
jgi:hypothetical protein